MQLENKALGMLRGLEEKASGDAQKSKSKHIRRTFKPVPFSADAEAHKAEVLL